jgi:hypothetical protein
MTDYGNDDEGSDGRWSGRADATAGSSQPDRTGAEEPPTREGWEQLPSDPDPRADLGYAFTDWEEFATLDGTDQVMFLPADESLLREDAFVVASEDTLLDLARQY